MNAFKALKLIHMKVVDESKVFPHLKEFPFKKSLGNLIEGHPCLGSLYGKFYTKNPLKIIEK